jgi:hypothetical protein
MSPIHIKKSHEGKLREELHAKQGKPISAAKLEQAKNSKSAVLRAQATFALNARKWKHK